MCVTNVTSIDKNSNIDRNRAYVDKNNEYCKNDDTRHAVHPGGTAQHAHKKYGHLCQSLIVSCDLPVFLLTKTQMLIEMNSC